MESYENVNFGEDVCRSATSWWAHSWLRLHSEPFSDEHLATASDICSYLSITKMYDELDSLVEDVIDKYPDHWDEFLKRESFLLAAIELYLWRRKFSEVYRLIQMGNFSNNENAIVLWDQAHYKEMEYRTGKILSPVTKFRIRIRNPPPFNICPGGFRLTHVLPKDSVSVLRDWFDRHRTSPFPNKEDLEMLAQASQLTALQVRTWFANARRRNTNYYRMGQDNLRDLRTNVPQRLRVSNKRILINQKRGRSQRSPKAKRNLFTSLQDMAKRKFSAGGKRQLKSSIGKTRKQIKEKPISTRSLPENELEAAEVLSALSFINTTTTTTAAAVTPVPATSVEQKAESVKQEESTDLSDPLVIVCAPIFLASGTGAGNPPPSSITLSPITCNTAIDWSCVGDVKRQIMVSILNHRVSEKLANTSPVHFQNDGDIILTPPEPDQLDKSQDEEKYILEDQYMGNNPYTPCVTPEKNTFERDICICGSSCDIERYQRQAAAEVLLALSQSP